jgi:hypothetical protein
LSYCFRTTSLLVVLLLVALAGIYFGSLQLMQSNLPTTGAATRVNTGSGGDVSRSSALTQPRSLPLKPLDWNTLVTLGLTPRIVAKSTTASYQATRTSPTRSNRFSAPTVRIATSVTEPPAPPNLSLPLRVTTGVSATGSEAFWFVAKYQRAEGSFVVDGYGLAYRSDKRDGVKISRGEIATLAESGRSLIVTTKDGRSFRFEIQKKPGQQISDLENALKRLNYGSIH